MSGKQEEPEKGSKATATISNDGDNNDNFDDAGVPKMTPLQKRLFELRQKGVK